MNAVKRVALVVLYAIPPLFAALYTGATEIEDGSFTPWRANMVDLEVYARTAHLVLEGKDFYNVEVWLPFIYPPFAALLAIPLAPFGEIAGETLWLLVNAILIVAVLRRLGWRGWRLSLTATAAIVLFEPIRRTLGFGQVNVIVMALVALDLMAGDRWLGTKRRLLPEGVLTGIATAIKLTPALFVVHLFLSGRIKASLTAGFTFLGTIIVGWIFLPRPSLDFWGRLFVSRDSGMNPELAHYTNQSLVASYIRFAGENTGQIPLAGILLAGLVGVIGIVAAVLWERAGQSNLALSLIGVTTLLVSPISWSHHFVWVLPLASLLITETVLPIAVRFVGMLFSLWVMYAPFMQFPPFGDELAYTVGQKLIDAGSMLLGVSFLAVTVVLALRDRRRAGLPLLPLTLRATESTPGAVRIDPLP